MFGWNSYRMIDALNRIADALEEANSINKKICGMKEN